MFNDRVKNKHKSLPKGTSNVFHFYTTLAYVIGPRQCVISLTFKFSRLTKTSRIILPALQICMICNDVAF